MALLTTFLTERLSTTMSIERTRSLLETSDTVRHATCRQMASLSTLRLGPTVDLRTPLQTTCESVAETAESTNLRTGSPHRLNLISGLPVSEYLNLRWHLFVILATRTPLWTTRATTMKCSEPPPENPRSPLSSR